MSNQFVRSVKNVVKGYSSTQVLVRNATANEGTGPNIDLLDDISEKTYDSVDFFEIMDMLDKRLNDKGKYWKHIAKSLTVLDYLVRFGSENCVLWCKENLYLIKTLTEFRYEDESSGGIDQGQIIRVKAKELTALLNDDERLREERRMNGRRNRKRRTRDNMDRNNRSDEDLQRALDESRRTAEEDERRRRMQQDDDSDLQAALQLSKEEEELKRLQELQRSMNQPQQQVYYDIFGNPISYEEWMQYQMQQDQLQKQQQNEWLLQQKQQELLAQQQQQEMLLQQQQFLLAQQQQQAAYLAQQQAMMQQMPMQTGANNPFALNNQQAYNNNNDTAASELPDFSKPAAQTYKQSTLPEQVEIQQPVQQQIPQPVQQPLQQNRTGNQDISNKFSELNQLLASGTGLDTFGNTGETRIPAQHTKTGTFINSQGTGFKQVANESKVNPFLNNQYTGLPSSNIMPTQTGYGFGNQQQPQQQQQQQYQQQQYQQQQYQQQQYQQQQPNNNQGVSLIDL